MRNLNRNAKALSILAAAAGLTASVQLAQAQWVWTSAVSGNWNDTTKWTPNTVPVPSAATTLTFNDTGATSYTATNNVATPFQLETLTVNPTSTGVITVAAGGLTGDTTSSITMTGTGTANVSGGGTLGYIRVDTGTLITSGDWHLTSTTRENDVLTGNTGGFWEGNVRQGAWIQNGGTIFTAGNGLAVATRDNDTGGLIRLNGVTWNDTGSRLVVNQGDGTFELVGGTTANVFLVDLGRQDTTGSGGSAAGTSRLTVDASSLTNTQFVTPGRGAAVAGFVTVRNNGTIITNGNTFQADGVNATGDPLPGVNTTLVDNSHWIVAGDGAATGFNQWALSDNATMTFQNNAVGTTVHSFVASAPGTIGVLNVGTNSTYTGTDFFIQGGGGTDSGNLVMNITAGGKANAASGLSHRIRTAPPPSALTAAVRS